MAQKTEITTDEKNIITLLKKKVCPNCGKGVKDILDGHPVGEYEGHDWDERVDHSKVKLYRIFVCCNEECPIDEWKIQEKLANDIEQQMAHGKM